MKVKLEEEIKTEEARKTLYLRAPYWYFKTSISKLDSLKTELENLQDKGQNTDIRVFAFIAAGLAAKTPKRGKGNIAFSVKDSGVQETIDAVVEALYEKIGFNPQAKQRKLVEKNAEVSVNVAARKLPDTVPKGVIKALAKKK